jgi:hypothetical protein
VVVRFYHRHGEVLPEARGGATTDVGRCYQMRGEVLALTSALLPDARRGAAIGVGWCYQWREEGLPPASTVLP